MTWLETVTSQNALEIAWTSAAIIKVKGRRSSILLMEEIPNNHLGCIKTANLNWWLPDFWTFNSSKTKCKLYKRFPFFTGTHQTHNVVASLKNGGMEQHLNLVILQKVGEKSFHLEEWNNTSLLPPFISIRPFYRDSYLQLRRGFM